MLAIKLSASVAFLQFVLSWWSYSMLQISAEKLSFTLRAKYLDSLMRQETEYFETQQIEALPAKISEYFLELPSASGDKYNAFFTFLGMMISGFTVAFVAAPNFALLLLLYFPVFVGVVAVYGRYSRGQTALKLKQNAALGGYTEEVLSALKLVISFGREEHSVEHYNVLAEQTKNVASKAALANGFFFSIIFFGISGLMLTAGILGGLFIQNGWGNWRTGESIKVTEVVTAF